MNLFFFKLINLFLAVLGLPFCARAFPSCGERGPLSITARGPLTVVASLVAEHRLQMRRLSSCGPRAQLLRGMWDLPPDQGSNPCPLHWQADSQALRHQGSPQRVNLKVHYGLELIIVYQYHFIHCNKCTTLM